MVYGRTVACTEADSKHLRLCLLCGSIIPGILRAFFISPLAVVQITLLNMVYYSVVYVLLLPVYCISARAYESEHYMCMPSGTRFLEEVCCDEKNK